MSLKSLSLNSQTNAIKFESELLQKLMKSLIDFTIFIDLNKKGYEEILQRAKV